MKITEKSVLNRWKKIVKERQIPSKAYEGVKTRIIKDLSGISDFTFRAVLNSYRHERFNLPEGACPLCEVSSSPNHDFFPEDAAPGFIITPNAFPILVGASLAVSDSHRRMYLTSDSNLAEEFMIFFRLADKTGLRAAHQTRGAGATIPQHEHYHLVAFDAEEEYGFEAADHRPLTRGSRVSVMPGFPFSHLIFPQDDPEHFTYFLRKMGDSIGHFFPDNNYQVPHI
jgi:hypothetical protein